MEGAYWGRGCMRTAASSIMGDDEWVMMTRARVRVATRAWAISVEHKCA